MEIIEIESAGSTNSWLAERVRPDFPDCLVFAREQTAGRGQRGNSWEAEPGMNLTASMLLHPEGIEPSRQFAISEAVALAVVDLLSELGVEGKVKWPNDIYVGERKICGILIEHAIMGRAILHTIAGVGINVNQMIFRSDAPNPVSLRQLTGRDYDIGQLAGRLATLTRQALATAEHEPEALHSRFMAKLWRGDGKRYPFHDKIRGERFMGRVHSIAPEGTLAVEDEWGGLRAYAFKEVEFVLDNEILKAQTT